VCLFCRAGGATLARGQNYEGGRLAEGQRRWASLWDLAVCYGDGQYSPRNELAVSSTGGIIGWRGGRGSGAAGQGNGC